MLLSGIGDVVHGLPLVNALKRDDKNRQITWIVERSPAPLLGPHPAVDDIVLFDRVRGLPEVRALRSQLKSRRFDLVINCGIYFKSAIPAYFATARHKAAFGRDRANDLVWLFANHRLPARGPSHRQDMYLEFLDYMDIEREPLEWRLTLTGTEREEQSRFFGRLGAGRIAGIVATSAMDSKDWPTERFARVATALERDFGFRVLLLGGPGGREQRRAREVERASEARCVWALGDELRRLVWLLERCDLLIAPDTGPLHIARALDTPVIGLYGHTDPRRAGPYRAFEELTVDRYNFEADGRPYDGPVERQHPARPGARPGRMELIEPETVLEKVETAVGRYLSARRPAL